MSTLRRWWRRAQDWANAPTGTMPFTPQADRHGETMSLRDWSDLPTHHPRSERTPR
ncbi:MAG: hypothetical protein KIS86_18510 [Devosia sp.]|nr:hypothetical protein [Devosia sp.]